MLKDQIGFHMAFPMRTNKMCSSPCLWFRGFSPLGWGDMLATTAQK